MFTSRIQVPFNKRPPKKKRPTDGDAPVVEYDRGYLREQQKIARGVYSKKRQAVIEKKQAESNRPIFSVDPSAPIELEYVVEIGAAGTCWSEALPLQIWWRSKESPTGDGKRPLRPFLIEKNCTLPEYTDRRIIEFLLPYIERKAGSRGNSYLIPADRVHPLNGLLWEARQLRWGARDSQGVWRLHPLAIPSADRNTPYSVYMPRLPEGGFGRQVVLHALSGDYPLESFTAVGRGGWVMTHNELHCIQLTDAWPVISQWYTQKLQGGPRALSFTQALAASQQLCVDGGANLEALPEAIRCEAECLKPSGQLYISTARYTYHGQEQLQATVEFNYDGTVVPDAPPEKDGTGRISGKAGRVILRNAAEEESLRQELRQQGFRFVARNTTEEDPGWKLLPTKLEAAVMALLPSGWEITAEGKNYRRPVTKNLTVASFGIDWLEINAEVDFGDGQTLQTPQLLQALHKGQKWVLLDDGTYGVLPSEWLQHFTALTEIGDCSDGRVRLRQQQARLIELLLKERIEDADGVYTALKKSFTEQAERVSAVENTFHPPADFQATLRPYQLIGAQWLDTLGKEGFGGILADDMGLGKTIQVIALLSHYYAETPSPPPSLIVMPSSLLFNWESEFQRFAPSLSIGIYHGNCRTLDIFSEKQIVLTTYGTLRIDALRIAEIQLSYAILDEAQAIKNMDSGTAKAARILKALRRIAMTGTPVENHLAELFSQLSFLNPGLFTPKVFSVLGNEKKLLHDAESAQRLRQCVSPFILRRRKEQVATELPPKTEQILFCEMDEEQMARYTELRDYYKAKIAEDTNAVNMLSALLRLRQAACHCGLVNPDFIKTPSAKLAMMQEMAEDLISSGHKVLIFSQFTAMLRIISQMLTNSHIRFCYLDGATDNRGELVSQFQQDESIGAFLISLKAGGVGLNLTAADYVFIADPWWNPAAEAQAIDRAYRIGQTRPVMAYRLITKGTVEEKVLRMQNLKRRIAAAALNSSDAPAEALPAGVTIEDLRQLLT